MPKGKQKTFGRSRPSYAYELKFRRDLQAIIKEMQKDTRKTIETYWNSNVVTDAPGDEQKKGRAQFMADLRAKWYKRFEDTGKVMAAWLADKSNKRTSDQISRKLKQIGWTLHNPEYTSAQKETIRALAENSVSYIMSIPQKYLRNVQRHVAESVERGGDRFKLARELAALYERLDKDEDKALEYAELVARDQTNKMTQGYAIINAEQFGATKGRWIHIQGMKSSRVTHIEMDGQEFLLEQGLYDPDVEEYVKPGELPYCNCQFEVLLPGFDE